MHDKAEFFIAVVREKVFCLKTLLKSEAEFLFFHNTPEIIVEVKMTIYRMIPSFIEPRIPTPTPDITKAIDGFEHNGKIVSYSC